VPDVKRLERWHPEMDVLDQGVDAGHRRPLPDADRGVVAAAHDQARTVADPCARDPLAQRRYQLELTHARRSRAVPTQGVAPPVSVGGPPPV
jgi:hypothetical protein